MSDEIGNKKIGKVTSTDKAKAIKKADAVSNVDKVEQVRAAQSIAGVRGVGGTGRVDLGGRVVTAAERARLLQIVDDEAKKMFATSPKTRELIFKAVSQAIDSGLIVEEGEDKT
jgi:hypothetical protein